MRKIIVTVASIAMIIAVGILWSTFVLVKPQASVKKAEAAEIASSVSPFEIMVQSGSNLPAEKWDDTPF
jgi:hypothetical protein